MDSHKRTLDTAGESSKRSRPDGFVLPTGDKREAYRETYRNATPYKYIVVKDALPDDLLENVVSESRHYTIRGEEDSLQGWGWEQKETDIYKIQQTPDLASLDPDKLPEATLAKLPHLAQLKSHLYSPEFRQFVQDVTGCGPLSGRHTDGSVGLYSNGSHLLLHDDSISTRVISYILYLPNSPLHASASPYSTPAGAGHDFTKGWDPAWGGALELYPVADGSERGVPGTTRVAKVDVTWGQIIFFEVKPGRSYHAVEEVVVGEGRQRLGVSGWFHRPVEGETGYQPADALRESQALSSLAQITSAPSEPFVPYTEEVPLGLTRAHRTFLSRFLAPSYLTAATLEKVAAQVINKSEIVMHNVLKADVAAAVKAETRAADARDFPRRGALNAQDAGTSDGWALVGPASKQRYARLAGPSASTPTLRAIETELYPSEAFRAWLHVVASYVPLGRRVEARRFRPGLDYTLAHAEGGDLAAAEDETNEEDGGGGANGNGEAAQSKRDQPGRLDASLCLTWWADVPPDSDSQADLMRDGGWDCYLPAPDEGEDPAVYQSQAARLRRGEEPAAEVADLSGEPAAAPPQPNGEPAANGANAEERGGAEVVEGRDGDADGDAEESAEGPDGEVDGDAEEEGAGDDDDQEGGGGLEFDPDQFSPSDFDDDSDDNSSESGGGVDPDEPYLQLPVGFNRLLITVRPAVGVLRFVKYLSASAPGSRWDVCADFDIGVIKQDESDDEEQEEAAA